MMGDKCWTTKLTTYELSEQLTAMVIFNLDEADGDPYDDAEILDVLQAFNDRMPDDGDQGELIATLNVYAVAQWNHVAMCLTNPHLRLIHDVLENWQVHYEE